MPINQLIEGFKSFRETYYEKQPKFYRMLVNKGQRPDVMVIACSDSRVDPSILTKAEPGEIFIVRNVANLVPPYKPDSHYHGTSAAIEFAVRDLKVEHVIVFGHSHCGGIQRLCQKNSEDGEREFIDSWVSIVDTAWAASHDLEPGMRDMEKKAIEVSLDNLMTFPWVKIGVDAGNMDIRGWWFDLEAGELLENDGPDNWKKVT